MKTFFLLCSFFLVATMGLAQSSTKPEKFGNATVDSYIDSVYSFIDKQKLLSGELDTLETDIAKAKEEENEDAIDGLVERFSGIETAYGLLEKQGNTLGAEGTNALKATTECGLKAPKCAAGIKTATAALKETVTSIVADKAKMAEIKAKAEAAKKAMEKTDG